MGTSARRNHCRAGLLAAAVAAAGLAAPLAAQSPGWNTGAPRPANAWPDYPVMAGPKLPPVNGPRLPPTGGPIDGPPTGGAPDATGVAPAKVWNIVPSSRPTTAAASPGPLRLPAATGGTSPAGTPERNPRDFGSGLRTVLNQRGAGAGPASPAATLMAPRDSVPSVRPDWAWHGYDQYNTHSRPAAAPQATQQISASPNAADLAPYLKYAHLWHPTHNGYPGVNLAAAPLAVNPAAASTPPPTPTPTTPAPPVQWRGADGADGVKPAEFASPGGWPAQEPTGRLPLAVRERISAVCAGRAKSLVVEPLSPIKLRIALTARTQAEAEMLTGQLAALPELRPYKVDFEVQIGQ